MSEVSIIIPTYNESENIVKVLNEIELTLSGHDYEVIVVDDNSPDQTSEIVKKISKANKNILCIKRTWKKGLSSAVIEGVALSSKELVCVMDGDGQHDPKDILKMLEHHRAYNLDLVSGSRFLNLSSELALSQSRKNLSDAGIFFANLFLKKKMTDPMTGLFLIKKNLIENLQDQLYKDGFKILFDILMLNKTLKSDEVQINFRSRIAGDSKLNISTIFNMLGQVMENITKGFMPASFFVFSLVGTVGVAIHLTSLSLLLMSLGFVAANAVSTVLAMTSNYFLNNYLTFHNLHKTFRERFQGLIKYSFTNSFSILANIGVASQFYANNFSEISSALIGILAGLVLNYFLSLNLVFKK